MQIGEPSRTARGAAAHRALHQTLEGGVIFSDPFAIDILGDDTRAILPEMAADPSHQSMRLFIAARSRFSEDKLSACAARGVRQVVVLGAGLDTFSLRNPHADLGVRVFEVDYPATQGWKRERLKQASLAIPSSLTFAPIDFERQSLADGLGAAGFRADRPAFFQWLGVSPYLTREAIVTTLDFVVGLPESEIVFDYTEPIASYPPDRRANLMAIAERAAAWGEPWLSLFDPAEMSSLLQGRGFDLTEDLSRADIAERYYGDLKRDDVTGAGPHMVWAKSR
jgi:methyltransferase (TIGR00027 family)